MPSRAAIILFAAVVTTACRKPDMPTASTPGAGASPPAAFRASGSEPFWTAELEPGETPVLRVDMPGRERPWLLKHLTPASGGYRGRSQDGHEIELRIDAKPCIGENGQAYPAAAHLTVDGRRFDGCGRFEGGR
jgi:uncharacterized membrane protein